MSELDESIENELAENLEDGEIDTDDDQMNPKIDISKLDSSYLKDLELLKTSLTMLTEEIDKISCSDDKHSEKSNKEKFKTSTEYNKTKKRRMSKKPSSREKKASKKSSKIIDLDLYEDIDEYELLGVRGGSPPPQESKLQRRKQPKQSLCYISDESTYDLEIENQSRRMNKDKNRRYFNKKYSEKDNNWSRISKSDIRKKNSNDDFKLRIDETNKRLEICKYYLTENCCEIKNCSYMHSDFPCKFFYLGMECTDKPACKFVHGKPLSKSYRRMLLHHIQMAPKEILDNFEKISNEKATELLMKQHDKLCNEYGIDEATCGENKNSINNEPIPSLLDMVIKLPKKPILATIAAENNINSINNRNKNNYRTLKRSSTIKHTSIRKKHRKSRWARSNLNKEVLAAQIKIEESLGQRKQKSNSFQSQFSTKNNKVVLNLKLLSNILSMEQIEKLESLGVQNLDQLSQMSLSKLKLFGLTSTQINAVQLNTINMEKLGMLQHTTSNIILSPPEIRKIKQNVDDEETELCIDEPHEVKENSEKDCNKSKDNLFNNNAIKLCPPTIPDFNDSMKLKTTKVIDISSTVSSMLMEINLENTMNAKSPSSVYDDNLHENNESLDIFQTKTDVDMRIIKFVDLIKGDTDLRFPYNPMIKSSIPAVEINGIMKNSMEYRVNEILIPESDYTKIYDAVTINEKLQDPRLRKLYNSNEMEPEKRAIIDLYNESLTLDLHQNKIEETSYLPSKNNQLINSVTNELESIDTSLSSTQDNNNRTTNIDLIAHLQKSQWYKDLNSKVKVMVNQQMALISSALKKFHQDIIPTKKFDTSFIVQNQLLTKILICLKIYIDNDGEIKHINEIEEIQNNNFYADQPIKSVGLLPTPITNGGLLPTPVMNRGLLPTPVLNVGLLSLPRIDFLNNQLNQNSYKTNFNYCQNQNYGNINGLQRFSSQNNGRHNFSDNNRLNNIQSKACMFNPKQLQSFQRNSFFKQNYNGNNINNESTNQRNNCNKNNIQYNNGGFNRRNKFYNEYTRGFNKI